MRQGKFFAAALAVAVSVPALSGPARAEVSAADASALQDTLRGWVAGLFAPLVQAAAVPITLAPAGDRYKAAFGVLLPEGTPGVKVTSSGPTTAYLRPLGGARWGVEEITLPADTSVAYDLGAASLASGKGKGTFSMHIGDQQMKAEIDPSLATPSHWEGRLGGVVEKITGTGAPQTTKLDKVGFDSAWTPSGGALLDGAANSTVDGYSTQAQIGGQAMTYTAQQVKSTVKAQGVDVARLRAALGTLSGLLAQSQAQTQAKPASAKPGARPDGKKPPTPEQRAALHRLLDALAGAFTQLDGSQHLSGLRFTYGDVTGSLAEAELGTQFGAPGGNARFGIRFAAAGLDSAALPPGDIRKLVPQRLVLAPSLSGVPKAALVGFLSHAIDSAGTPDDDMEAAGAKLLAENPATLGIDELLLDLGLAKLGGKGRVQFTSPAEINGEAELRMTGLDALIKLLGQLPETKPVVPVAIMLKGIGKAEGGETVWHVAYAAGHVTVNGTDMSALIPGKP